MIIYNFVSPFLIPVLAGRSINISRFILIIG